jgi:hypothetical protein
MHLHALQTPLLGPTVVKKRLVFAKILAYCNFDFWKRWWPSGESSIARGEGLGRGWVFCKPVCKTLLNLTIFQPDYRGKGYEKSSVQGRVGLKRHSKMLFGVF